MKYMLLFLLGINIFAAPVGSVVTVEGNSFRKSIDLGNYTKINQGDIIYQGDEIRTYKNGKVKIIFSDDSIIYVASQSKMLINQVVYDVNAQSRETKITLLNGKLKSWVSSAFSSKKTNYSIETATSVIGVRGTKFVVNIDCAKYNDETEECEEITDKVDVGVFEGSVDVYNKNDITKHIENLKANTYTSVIGTTPPMPGIDIDENFINKFDKETEIETTFNLKVDFKKMKDKFKLKNILSKNDVLLNLDSDNNLKQERNKKNKESKNGNKANQNSYLNSYSNGYLTRPKTVIKFDITIKE